MSDNKKVYILTILLIVSVFLSGCIIKEKQILPAPNKIDKTTNTYDHKLFSIKLPALFTAKDGVIKPKNEKDWQPIVFDITSGTIKVDELLTKEKTRLKNLCTQTDGCGKIINNTTTTIDGKNGIKFTVQYQGRSQEDSNGYLNEYHYTLINEKNTFRFWTSANDLVNLQITNKVFDDIIKTILFK